MGIAYFALLALSAPNRDIDRYPFSVQRVGSIIYSRHNFMPGSPRPTFLPRSEIAAAKCTCENLKSNTLLSAEIPGAAFYADFAVPKKLCIFHCSFPVRDRSGFCLNLCDIFQSDRGAQGSRKTSLGARTRRTFRSTDIATSPDWPILPLPPLQ